MSKTIAMKSRISSKHILLLPFMAQGHMKPFLQLAHHIKRRTTNLTITILTTPANVQLLHRISQNRKLLELGSDSSSVVRLVPLVFSCSDHGLPDQVENTNAQPLDVIVKLLHASTALEAPVRRFVEEEIVTKEECPPLCIIADVFLGWAVQLAYSLASLPLSFSTAGAYGSAVYLSIWGDLPKQDFTEEKEFFHKFPETRRFLSSLDRDTSDTDEWCKFIKPQLSLSVKSVGWLCNTVDELEPMGLSILRSYIKLPVWGIASTKSIAANDEANMQSDQQMIVRWLDSQPQNSVVYICFGSQSTPISESQMLELAIGLEESGKRFIWVTNSPIGFDTLGFQQRVIETQKRGLLLHKWAPQMEILSHKSTGAFLSHCGWNSVLESLSQGIPMIGWPYFAEQVCNLRMLEEMGVAVELPRGPDNSFRREDVKRVVNMVLDMEGKGIEMKKKATEVGKSIHLATVKEDGGCKGSSIKAIDDVLQMLFDHPL
uniref:Glycosyltransferase n=1 Tax=Fagopyrum esculentum TaxID=3617 RepID=A0A0A1HAN7_FAGES|nr:UDP-glycose: glycosyltransferase UGT92H1 [Fagopyrum esculentum]